MIIVRAKNIEDAWKDAYEQLVTLKKSNQDQVLDDSVLLEDSAAIQIDYDAQPELKFQIENDKFKYLVDYKEYIPSVDYKVVEEEEEYWTGELYTEDIVSKVVKHLQDLPTSRRCVIDLWRDVHFEHPELPGACVTYMHFRIKNGGLEMHTHSRANDVHKLMLMDLHMMNAIHIWVAKRLGIKLMRHVHMVDSLHIFKRDKGEIEAQLKYLSSISYSNKLS